MVAILSRGDELIFQGDLKYVKIVSRNFVQEMLILL